MYNPLTQVQIIQKDTYNLVHGILILLEHYPNSHVYASDDLDVIVHIIPSNQDMILDTETLLILENFKWNVNKFDNTIWYFLS